MISIIENEIKYLIRVDSGLISNLWHRAALSGHDAVAAMIHQYYPFGNVGRIRRRQWLDPGSGFLLRDMRIDLDKRVWPLSDVMYSITHKHTLHEADGSIIPLEFEADLRHDDFVRILRAHDKDGQPVSRHSLMKLRFLISDDPFHWDVDFFPHRDDPEAGFVMGIAECEMPEGCQKPDRIPDILQPYMKDRIPFSNYNLATSPELFAELAKMSQSE